MTLVKLIKKKLLSKKKIRKDCDKVLAGSRKFVVRDSPDPFSIQEIFCLPIH